jgi:phosphorylase/glycogen(starch) synthase
MHTLFEVSWEVCNKVGGIHTVVSTKAKTLVQRYGDDYVAIGPWLLGNPRSEQSFEESAGFEGFAESCRAIGVPVRVGRWRIPGSPRVVLVEFSGLFERKDAILAGLWERHEVDSITGGWDYVEPVMFGFAAGLVLERWWHEFVAPQRAGAVAQFHEWMTGAGLLHVAGRVPAVATVFTTHATVLGRAMAGRGIPPASALEGRSPESMAELLQVRSKHSMERVCAGKADAFTTVSEITARESERFLGRRPRPLLPNGIDLEVMDALAAGVTRERARAAASDLAHRFLGESCEGAAFLLLSGRYEFHNKGIDLLLEAMARLNAQRGRDVVMFLTVPAGHSGVRKSLLRRKAEPLEAIHDPIGVTTHYLIDREHDPIQLATARLGLDNALGSRVKVIHVPIYLHPGDGLFDLPYEGMLRGMDMTLFPSFYEPWGYTPEESLAAGVPTLTTDLAGFGRWAASVGLAPADGVHILRREGVEDARAAAELARSVDERLAQPSDAEAMARTCRATAQHTAWSKLIESYYEAFSIALEASRDRGAPVPPPSLRPRVAVPASPSPREGRPRLFPFAVSATLPEPLRGLERLSRNYYWSWDPEGPELFEDLSGATWRSCGHDPVLFLRVVFPEDLHARASDPRYVEKLRRVLARFDAYVASASSEVELGGVRLGERTPIAYFCAEFGVHESLKTYSGGLGVLAGDHLKSASDLGLPFVGVGLFYRRGYLRQRLTPAGEQVALQAENEPRNLPLELVRDEAGAPVEVTLALPSSTLVLRAWCARVGRVRLYLLDADLERNRPEDRAITHTLYGGDAEARLRQEIALGRGGARLLHQLGIEPAVWHINEGHAAFMALERVGKLVRDEGLTFDEARELVRSTTVFTTHTPVPAGHDRFGEDLIRRYFSDASSWVGLAWERFYALGQSEEDKTSFNMTYLALYFAGYANGVSKLHGEVSKELLHPFWPRLLRAEVPIRSITNGVHLASWTDPALGRLLGAGERAVVGADFAARAKAIDLEELWKVRVAARRRLLETVRGNLERGFLERHDSPRMLTRTLAGLDEGALLVGFARRFAPYKRARLVFQDLERMRSLLEDEERPVRIFFAGKAHPYDQLGQEVLKAVVQTSRSEPFLGKVFFLEDYDIHLARALVQGVDVWLNTPVRTLEASGTSGMKAAANGVLNLSVPDGWWVEAYDGQNGWSIGEGRTYDRAELQDELDAANLARLLEEEVVPLFFERVDGVPRRWLERARASLATIPPRFNTDRMLAEYRDAAYLPLARAGEALRAARHAPLKEIVAEQQRLRRGFERVTVAGAHVSNLAELKVGDRVEARVELDLDGLAPSDVSVELVIGHTRPGGDLRNASVVPLHPLRGPDGGPAAFEGSQRLDRSGSFACGIRVRPRALGPLGDDLRDVVLWA